MKERFYIGSYAPADRPGIWLAEADFETRKLTVISSAAGAENPSWVLPSPDGKLLYCVEEVCPDGKLSTFRTGADGGSFEKIGSLPTRGDHPCHISMSPDGRYLFVCNYTSGSIAVFRLDKNGIPQEMSDFRQHVGHGLNPERQEGPHCHFSELRDGLLYVSDLGLDRIFVYEFDEAEGRLSETDVRIDIPAGNGPRHFSFSRKHPDLLYVICELTANVYVMKQDGDVWRIVQEISSLPEGFAGFNISAAIRQSPDGTGLFVSNRGLDAVTMFGIGADGLLTKEAVCPTGGRTPRDFNIFGDYILAANWDSSNLHFLRIGGGGTLEPEDGSPDVPAGYENGALPGMQCPVCIRHIPGSF